MAFNEDTRVKIPAILHLQRLGYNYLPKKDLVVDESTNILTNIFIDAVRKINKIDQASAHRVFEEISSKLENEDLGKEFFESLIAQSNIKLIDFNNFDNNVFNVVTELSCRNGEEEFRPDITVFINGMPLCFIEVKKPNNHLGIQAERDRINQRFTNSRFKKFANITQLLIFSNNMEYDNSGVNPLAGAFYATPALDGDVKFNYFREEVEFDLGKALLPFDAELENLVLSDNHQQVIKHNPEFITNKNSNSPTNRILTSLLSRDRIKTLLQFGIAYVNDPKNGIQKHIMRYPQFFATKAIQAKLDSGVKKGVIWHTQGSGKTALAFYNVRFLTHYYHERGIIPKFYFIVDRLDLLTQASSEFTMRGLEVRTVNSKEEFKQQFSETKALHGASGKPEITVVNIQKFKDDTKVVEKIDYDVNVQRIYFLDEAHRSYDPKGSFLANLYESDRDSVKIALTGTPLIVPNSEEDEKKQDAKTTRNIFGEYIHKYYYNSSIKDGYTLRLIREGIESNYRMKLEEALRAIEVAHGDIARKQIYAHKSYVEPMLDYIIDDFRGSRVRFGDKEIGALVVCDSSEQARMMYQLFTEKYSFVAETPQPLKAALILHDEGTKESRRADINNFKYGKSSDQVDILFVYNMLLTGFDAHRLKKLYLGRVIKAHNLLQTLTRVNRPYKSFKYGFVVDFADISKEFDITNKAYFEELNQEYGDSLDGENSEDIFGSLFKSSEEINSEIEEIKNKLFIYDLVNAEVFSQQMSQIDDRKKVGEIVRLLGDARGLYNVAKLVGHYDLLEKIDFTQISKLFREASHRLDLLNAKASLERGDESQNILNVALEDVIFTFRKTSEEELRLADEVKDIIRKSRQGLGGNFDPSDPYFQTLYEEFKMLFEKCNMREQTQDEMRENMSKFERLFDKIRELNRNNDNLRAKYKGDSKFARTHKRIKERKLISDNDVDIYNVLMNAKNGIDERVAKSENIVSNTGYFDDLVMQQVAQSFHDAKVTANYDALEVTRQQIAKEYENEYDNIGVYA